MADSLLDNYNPLYDVHLRQYFALPHMQKHLRRLGLIDSSAETGDEVYARHHAMLDMMLKNREVQLMRMAELKRKLDAAEKVETCRRIRSGQSPESYNRMKSSRSLSRGRQRSTEKQRRYSNSIDDKEIVQKIEKEHFQPVDYDPKDPYSRLSANIKRFQYLHRLDDPTLSTYKETLKKQLLRLERFRDISFGVHSVARQPPTPHQSWFFRRRSTNSIRGRKSHHSPHSVKLSQSHESRTSCPPSTRKRKDSNSKLPPIGNGKATKSVYQQSHPSLLRATSPSQKPPIVRGRPLTKKLPATSKTVSKATHVVHPPTVQPENNGSAAPEVSGFATTREELTRIATTKKQPSLATIKLAEESSGKEGETPLMIQKEEPENRRDSISDREDRTVHTLYKEHLKETDQKFVVEEGANIENVGQVISITEDVVEPLLRPSEQQLQEVDLIEAEHGEHDEVVLSDQEMTGGRESSDLLTLSEESKAESAESHQAMEFPLRDFVLTNQPSCCKESETKHEGELIYSSEDETSVHPLKVVEQDIEVDKELVTGFSDLTEVPMAISVYKNEDDNERMPKYILSPSPTNNIVLEEKEKNHFTSTSGRTLYEHDLKLDDKLYSYDDHSLQEKEDEVTHCHGVIEEGKPGEDLISELQTTTPVLTNKTGEFEEGTVTASNEDLQSDLRISEDLKRVAVGEDFLDKNLSQMLEPDEECSDDLKQHAAEHQYREGFGATEESVSKDSGDPEEELEKHVVYSETAKPIVGHDENIMSNKAEVQTDDHPLKQADHEQKSEEVFGASKESAFKDSGDQEEQEEVQTSEHSLKQADHEQKSGEVFGAPEQSAYKDSGDQEEQEEVQTDDHPLKQADHEQKSEEVFGAPEESAYKDSGDQEEVQTSEHSLKQADHEQKSGEVFGAPEQSAYKDSGDQEEQEEVQTDDHPLKQADHEQKSEEVFGAPEESAYKDSGDQEEVQTSEHSLKQADHEQKSGEVFGAPEQSACKDSGDPEEQLKKRDVSFETTKPILDRDEKIMSTKAEVQTDVHSSKQTDHEQKSGEFCGVPDESACKDSGDPEEQLEKRDVSFETTKPIVDRDEKIMSTKAEVQTDDHPSKQTDHEQKSGEVFGSPEESACKDSGDPEEQLEKRDVSFEITKPIVDHDEKIMSTKAEVQTDDHPSKQTDHEQKSGEVFGAPEESACKDSGDPEEQLEKRDVSFETTKPIVDRDEKIMSTKAEVQTDDHPSKQTDHEQKSGEVFGAPEQSAYKDSGDQEEQEEVQTDEHSLKQADHEQKSGEVFQAPKESACKNSGDPEGQLEKSVISPETAKRSVAHDENVMSTKAEVQTDDHSLKQDDHEQKSGEVFGAPEQSAYKDSGDQEEQEEVQTDEHSLKQADHERKSEEVFGAAEESAYNNSGDQEEEFERRAISPDITKSSVSHEENIVPTRTQSQTEDHPLKPGDHEQQSGEVLGAARDGARSEPEGQEEECERRFIFTDTTKPPESDVMSTNSVIIQDDIENMAFSGHRIGGIPVPTIFESYSSISCLQKTDKQQTGQSVNVMHTSDADYVLSSHSEIDYKYDFNSSEPTEKRSLLEFGDIYDSQDNRQTDMEVCNETRAHEMSEEHGDHSSMDIMSPNGIRRDSRQACINGVNITTLYPHSEAVNDYTVSHDYVSQSFAGSDEENNNDDGKSVKLSDDETTSPLYNSGGIITEPGLVIPIHHQGENKGHNIPST